MCEAPPTAPPALISSRAARCRLSVPPAVADLLPYFQQEKGDGAGARVPLADQGAGARADHGGSRLGHPAPRPTAPRSTTRTSRSRPSSSVFPAGKARLADKGLNGPGPATRRAGCVSGGPDRWRVVKRQTPAAVARDPRAPAAAAASPYPHWFYLPAAIICAVLFLFPTFASLFFCLTRWTLFDLDLHRPR